MQSLLLVQPLNFSNAYVSPNMLLRISNPIKLFNIRYLELGRQSDRNFGTQSTHVLKTIIHPLSLAEC